MVVQFDYARHRRVLNFDRNYVRLNEFPEWFVADENTLYRLKRPAAAVAEVVRLGSELIEGVELAPGDWVVESMGPPPNAQSSPTPARRASSKQSRVVLEERGCGPGRQRERPRPGTRRL